MFFTPGCNIHSSPCARQYKVKEKILFLKIDMKVNLTFKRHTMMNWGPLVDILWNPWNPSPSHNLLLSISCLVIQGELNRRMSLLLHVQVDYDQIMTRVMKIMMLSHGEMMTWLSEPSSSLYHHTRPPSLHFHFPRMINILVFTFTFLQERVYPVALTEGATLLPSLLLLLIFILLSCVLLTILIIRGRWVQNVIWQQF